MLNFLIRMVQCAALCWLAGMPARAAAVDVPRHLKACGDINEFPPYTFFQREDGKITGQIAGFNHDYLAALLTPSQRDVQISLIPWKRCLVLAAAGQFDLVLDSSGQAERQRDFFVAQSHYSIRPIMMFSKEMAAPNGTAPEDIADYSRCEVLGWDYSGYNAPTLHGQVMRPSTLDGALRMLKIGRCQIMVHNLELVLGMRQVGKEALLEGLDWKYLHWLPSYELHLAVSRKLPHALALVQLLDQRRLQMRRSGETDKILKRYFP
jgi:polar amino acid transport system substrate-binding protein